MRPDLIDARGGLSDHERRLLEEFPPVPYPCPACPTFGPIADQEDPMKSTDLIDQDSMRTDIPDFGPGDELKVHVRVVEGGKERIQVFQGNVISIRGGGLQETYTVRKLSYGVGVERTFPKHSPTVAKVEVVKKGDVRRAKLYYLRDRVGKAARVREKREF